VICTKDWGCNCPKCKDRQHPFDRVRRLSEKDIEALYALSPGVIPPRKTCPSCGKPGRLYVIEGYRCEEHRCHWVKTPGTLYIPA
jgi:hypothetical protein